MQVPNKQVQIRAAEKCRIESTDYYCCIHRTSGDCQNPVEQSQAAVGKAMANGDRIHWEHMPLFHGMSEEGKNGPGRVLEA